MIGLDDIAAGADIANLSRSEVAALLHRLAAAQTRLAVVILADRTEDQTPAHDQLIDAVEMARRLGVTESWVRSEARAGRLPCIHLGKYVRFDPIAVAASRKGRR
jgi:hypothetical protein